LSKKTFPPLGNSLRNEKAFKKTDWTPDAGESDKTVATVRSSERKKGDPEERGMKEIEQGAWLSQATDGDAVRRGERGRRARGEKRNKSSAWVPKREEQGGRYQGSTSPERGRAN